jgi:cyclase
LQHFYDAFTTAGVDGALAASVFHDAEINIGDLKSYLAGRSIHVRA